ncbi:1-deoxy-D-xylulose-5-phosphate reductoisomerase [Pelagibacteraceae bacterium]|jgi:1-deoxy-D-xylulose-5-phosphate reductoisomerase|nr:1-deoxy-D-xylulose-5-phosphate reductoisomerase [Pelagibacteraceae bacterium]
MKKSISILGSTGSIGITTFDIIDKKKDYFKVNLLAANKNYSLICKQIYKYKPKYFVISDKKIYKKVNQKFKNKKIKILNDFNFKQLSKSYVTISAIPGIAGLIPTISMIKLSKKILIANKESVICGWNLIRKEALKYKTKILPIDSEHFSIFKLLEVNKLSEINKIYITASGGPFLKLKYNQLKKIKPKDALKHPKWKMGKKISVDSSTLMNKIFEVLEAKKLFNLNDNQIDILIHPQSLVHAIIVLKNGLTKFIYHETSMIIPLANAIFEEDFDIAKFYKIKKNSNKIIEDLNFQKVNSKIFPLVKLKNRINEHPSSPIIINAYNEILVDQFLRKKIDFLAISKTILKSLNDRNFKKYAIRKTRNINEIVEIDIWARKNILKKI